MWSSENKNIKAWRFRYTASVTWVVTRARILYEIFVYLFLRFVTVKLELLCKLDLVTAQWKLQNQKRTFLWTPTTNFLNRKLIYLTRSLLLLEQKSEMMSNNAVASLPIRYAVERFSHKSPSTPDTQRPGLQFWLHRSRQTTSNGFISMSRVSEKQMCSHEKHKIETFVA